MEVEDCILPGVRIIKPKQFFDDRGSFVESFNQKVYAEAGINEEMVQDNRSISTQGVIRGLHFQRNKPQGKLVWCSLGTVFDVVVDINPKSSTFAQHFEILLSDNEATQLWIPAGYAHGFCAITEVAHFQYKCTEFYSPEDEAGIIWDDPQINIKWPKFQNYKISQKDRNLPTLHQFSSTLY
jgi:dTDP-4-dehydrorhamnose 3,5-epimerase